MPSLPAASPTPRAHATTLGAHEWAAAGAGGLVAVGASKVVSVYAPSRGGRVLACLAGHAGRVNGVAWLPAPAPAGFGDETELASCCEGGEVRVWRIEG